MKYALEKLPFYAKKQVKNVQKSIESEIIKQLKT